MNIEITNAKEFEQEVQEYFNKKLNAIGFLVVNEIQDLIQQIPLFRTGDFWRGIHSYVEDGALLIEDSVNYGKYLEYGTYAYWDNYGLNNFPSVFHPKKMDMDTEMKKAFPKGMQPFAPFRRVLYNETKMKNILSKVFK